MSPEYVDIVDESDEVVGKTSKQEAHEKGLLHRAVIAEVIGTDGKWTLVKHSPDRQDPGQFVSPIGGHVEAGETAEQALIREAEEEYGLTGNVDFILKGKVTFNRTVIGRRENHRFIVYEIHSDKPPVLNHEAVGYERFSKDQLRKEMRENPRKFGDAFHFVVKTFYPDLSK
ncbi:MAG: NUDIX domain-containing protein [bacterium]|nr:NUDIX domain-containing protein [bacterium]